MFKWSWSWFTFANSSSMHTRCSWFFRMCIYIYIYILSLCIPSPTWTSARHEMKSHFTHSLTPRKMKLVNTSQPSSDLRRIFVVQLAFYVCLLPLCSHHVWNSWNSNMILMWCANLMIQGESAAIFEVICLSYCWWQPEIPFPTTG